MKNDSSGYFKRIKGSCLIKAERVALRLHSFPVM